MIRQVFPIDPNGYERHLIHARERQWAETNCYVDVWIELLHAWGFEPIAALPFTLTIDFEGDQWTFFKFPLADLHYLYGIDVQELQIWRPLFQHLDEQVHLGRPVLVELDSYYLPDTAGTAYRMAHVKSTVAVTEIDVQQKRLGYFHGQGYYHLTGDDFDNVLHIHGIPHQSVLPPYVEFAKRNESHESSRETLVRSSLERLKAELRKLPTVNPFEKFRTRFEADLKWLATEPIETFHQYSFATLRQFGACYELTGIYLRWLHDHAVQGLDQSIDLFDSLSNGAKTMQFQLARAMARKKTLDLANVDQMAATWKLATDNLRTRFLTSD
jgi:hypothetical protein